MKKTKPNKEKILKKSKNKINNNMTAITKKFPSVLKGETKFKLDERTKKSFAKLVQRTKKHRVEQGNFSQTIICGSEEFAQTQKKSSK